MGFFASKLRSIFGQSIHCSYNCGFEHTSIFNLMGVPLHSIVHVGASSSSLPGDPKSQETLPPITGIQESISPEKISRDPCRDSDSDDLGEEGEPGVLSRVAACGKEKNLDRIKSLEMQIEEERRECAALVLDLEMERCEAASAADEAMRMISRLQKEKSKIDLEARQYRRMIEEKCAYEADEMTLLKEIVVTTEREKRVFQKEVQMYKQMLYRKSFFEDKLATVADASSDDPMLMPQCISESIGRNIEGFVEADSLPILNPNGRACSSTDAKLFNNNNMGEMIAIGNSRIKP